MTSDKSLKRLYNRLNLAYFGGQLPDVTVYWEPCQDAMAITFEVTDPVGDEREIAIKVDPQIAALWKVVKLVMLHEMCHVKLWESRAAAHGKKWWAEMERLWEIGAFRKEGLPL